MRRRIAIAVMVAAAPAGVRADPITLVDSRQGRLQFVLVGASMVDNQGLVNGVNCLHTSATTTIASTDLPLRPRLVSATLYLAGSMFSDDGPDYNTTEIFTTPGLRADDPAQLGAVEDAARAAADLSVDFQPPGAAAPITVSAAPGSSYVSAFFLAGTYMHNVAFTMTPIDVTDEIMGAGAGILEGDYTVSGLLADVCNGAEAVCNNPPSAPTCGTESAVHVNGAASFALLLLVDDPELPLHSIAVFEGMRNLSGTSLELRLQTVNAISDPAAGSLGFYALEGDLLIPQDVNTGGDCNGDEYIEVDGDLDPDQNGLCLVDDDNPVGNIFNSTINVQQPTQPPPTCTEPANREHRCCMGDGQCPKTGIDLDRFDISAALVPGVNEVRVTVATGTDRIALGLVVLGVDVFEPVLNVDTQVRVFEAIGGTLRQVGDGEPLQVGADIVYSIALSNTGNVSATGVGILMPAPPSTSGLTIVRMPSGATDNSSATGGANGTGVADVGGFDVPAGEIAEIRIRVTPSCAAATPIRLMLGSTITVRSNELPNFDIDTPRVEIAGPGVGPTLDACEGTDPTGPFGDGELLPLRRLRGGGCNATGIVPWLAALACLALGIGLRRRQRALLGMLLLALLTGSGCLEKHVSSGGDGTTPSRVITSLDGLPGESCGSPLMVWVTRVDDTRFCIDRFEATTDGGALGDAHQGSDDLDAGLNGSTTAVADVALGEAPTAGISWYQARAACENAGKRLCSLAEWERACRGLQSLIYPYGDSIDQTACNGFFAYTTSYENGVPESTGSFDTCGSAWGAYDMSGNLEEWTLDAWPRLPGTTPLNDRAVRGGSFKSNSNALACIGQEFHEPPGSVDIDRGFRCCSDAPVI